MFPRTRSIPRAAARSLLVGALAIAGLSMPQAIASTAGAATTPAAVTDPASLVNPFIGTANGANDFPGADSPFGMVQWSPDTSSRPAGGGYAYGDSSLIGYSLTHVPGPGDPVAGDFPILPSLGTVSTTADATFSHTNETAEAGYYSLTTNDGIKTELTTTTRSGMARFTFPATTQAANLIFKMGDSEAADSGVAFTYVSANEVSGQETTGNFGGHSPKYTVYFDMVFDQPITAHGTDYVSFGTNSAAATVVQAKVGLSYVSAADANGNWQAENPSPTFNFAATQTSAHNAWNSVLSRLAVSGGTATQQTVFYTALYHSLLFPQVFSDSNGKYMSADGKTVESVDSGHSAFYTTFSGWDIYRTQAQLTALADPSVADDIAQSMVDDYTQTGQFPKWMLNNGESYDMAGDPADDILADYYAFGATNFDTSTALKDMVAEATNTTTTNNIRPGLAYLEQLGYLPNDGTYSSATPPHYYASASTTLEYASNDASISFLAGALNDTSDQTTFINRAQDWRNLFDYGTGFIQPRNLNGSWMSGFSSTGGWGYCCDSPSVYFAEGDTWQYTPMVPFNIQGLADAEGGDAKLSTFLDTDLSSFTGGNGYADLTNEPSLDIPWEYDYIGEPSKTQAAIRKIQDQVWTDAPGGLAGNDDLGTMSAWYVWSALGMYPETPGTADLALGSPLFPQVSITLPSGKTLTVKGDNAADNAPYVQSATWAPGTGTAATWNNAYVPTNALTGGGTLDFALGTTAPATAWASAPSSAPPSYQGSVTYDNAGISDDTAQSSANFDGAGNSYSAQALATAGLTPGAVVTAGGLDFTWPGAASGRPDNYAADGQVLPLTGSGEISFLGSATNGPSTGTATVTYTDGTTQAVPITLSDWTLNGGTASASSGNTTVATSSYRNKASGTSQTINTYLFATAPVTLTAGKTVKSVTLPSSTSSGVLHVFAVATQTGPIGSGVASGQCLDDYHSLTTNGNLIQVHGCNGTGAQEWTVNTTSNTLTVLGSCLDVIGAGTANGTSVDLWSCNGGANQVWKPGANGSLVNPSSGLCLDDPGASTTGARLQIETCNGSAEQRWLLP